MCECLGKTIVHEYHVSYSQTKCYLRLSDSDFAGLIWADDVTVILYVPPSSSQ